MNQQFEIRSQSSVPFQPLRKILILCRKVEARNARLDNQQLACRLRVQEDSSTTPFSLVEGGVASWSVAADFDVELEHAGDYPDLSVQLIDRNFEVIAEGTYDLRPFLQYNKTGIMLELRKPQAPRIPSNVEADFLGEFRRLEPPPRIPGKLQITNCSIEDREGLLSSELALQCEILLDNQVIGRTALRAGGARKWEDVITCHYNGEQFLDIILVDRNASRIARTTSCSLWEECTRPAAVSSRQSLALRSCPSLLRTCGRMVFDLNFGDTFRESTEMPDPNRGQSYDLQSSKPMNSSQDTRCTPRDDWWTTEDGRYLRKTALALSLVSDDYEKAARQAAETARSIINDYVSDPAIRAAEAATKQAAGECAASRARVAGLLDKLLDRSLELTAAEALLSEMKEAAETTEHSQEVAVQESKRVATLSARLVAKKNASAYMY